jgi:hypothetical protein
MTIERMGAAIDSLHGQRYGRFYLYPGTRTLENRKNIRDAKELQNFESSRFCGGILKLASIPYLEISPGKIGQHVLQPRVRGQVGGKRHSGVGACSYFLPPKIRCQNPFFGFCSVPGESGCPASGAPSGEN